MFSSLLHEGIIIRIKLPTLRDLKPPLPSVRREDAQPPLPSLKQREPKPLLPSVRQADAQLPLPSLKQRELKPPLPSVRQVDEQLPLPLLKQREPKPPLPSVGQADAQLPKPSLKQRELKPPLRLVRQSDAQLTVPLLKQREAEPLLPSVRQADAQVPFPSLKQRCPEPLYTQTAAQVKVAVNNKLNQIAEERPAVDEQPSSSGRAVETWLLDREAAAPMHRTTSSSKKVGSRTRQQEKFDELIVNWNTPPLQLESLDAEGDDWLVGAPKLRSSSYAAESKSSNGSGSNVIFSLQPRARYLPEFDMYQLPYTVPF
ncbi:hypothetical protein GW17_00036119 [Ensete ventricosum]|nr:hypothetical protein GW17_00036119 [Ensete ventricosum]